MEGTRRKERPRELPRVPTEKRNQEDGGDKQDEGARRKEGPRGLPWGPMKDQEDGPERKGYSRKETPG